MKAKAYYKRPNRVRAIRYYGEDNRIEVVQFIYGKDHRMESMPFEGLTKGHWVVDVGHEIIYMSHEMFNAIYQEDTKVNEDA